MRLGTRVGGGATFSGHLITFLAPGLLNLSWVERRILFVGHLKRSRTRLDTSEGSMEMGRSPKSKL